MGTEKNIERVWLQDRDFEILRFCLEMKFSSLEALNERFFDAKSQDMFAARKRVQKLEANGHLKSVSMLSGTTKKFYLATAKGYREFTAKHDLAPPSQGLSTTVPKPVTKLSIVTFEHDLMVLKSRQLLERQGRARDWRSERVLKAMAASGTGGLARDFMPDGIFTSKNSKVCAFEFENRPKNTDKLKEKIFRLNALMGTKDPVFEACLFIASSDSLKNKIKNITDIFPNKFVVQSMSELINFES